MDLELHYRPTTGRVVTPELFGGNHLFTRNAVDPDGSFAAAIKALGVDGLRYPGGTMTERWGADFYEAPNTAPANAAAGDIFVGLDSFLDFAKAEGQPVTVVLPTSHLFEGVAEGVGNRALNAGAVEQAADFVAALLEDNPDVAFAGFEIGNEYWNPAVDMTSAEYGIAANAMAIALQAAMDEGLGAGADQPAILIQMGDPWGRDFRDGVYAGTDMTWMEKIAAANDDILAQMTGAGRDAVDGVIEHYYHKGAGWALHLGDALPGEAGVGFNEVLSDIQQVRANWNEAAHGALEVAITEWGVSRQAESQYGMPGAGVTLEMFEGLLRMGADSASVWPIELNATNDLAGSHNRPDAADADLLTPIGEAFRLMAEHTIGLELYNNGFGSDDRAVQSVEVNTFGSDERLVVFLSSRSDAEQEVSLDVSDYVDGFSSLSGVRIVQENPGQAWNLPNLFAETEALDASDLGNGTTLDVTLGAFEVVMVEYQRDAATSAQEPAVSGDPLTVLRGNASADVLDGTDGRDKILGRAGDDRLLGRSGDDRIAGNLGNDLLHGALGDDRLNGGAGGDRLTGGAGDDLMRGGAGNDHLRAGDGNDTLWGGAGNDAFFFGGEGFNIVGDFGRGNDRINLRGEGLRFAALDIYDDALLIAGELNRGTVVDYGEGAVLLLGVSAGELTAADFVL